MVSMFSFRPGRLRIWLRRLSELGFVLFDIQLGDAESRRTLVGSLMNDDGMNALSTVYSGCIPSASSTCRVSVCFFGYHKIANSSQNYLRQENMNEVRL